MKLVSYEFGQVLQLVRMEEVRPISGVYLPDLFRAISERYRFVDGPSGTEQELVGSFKFANGVLERNGQTIAVSSLGVYSDGILVVCRKTDDADLVVDDFISWLRGIIPLREPTTEVTRRHTSHVVVTFDAPIECFIERFNAISHIYQEALEMDQHVKIRARLQRISFSADPLDGLSLQQTSFSLEPRSGVPFTENRYFSTAPMASAAHLRLLSNIDTLIGARA